MSRIVEVIEYDGGIHLIDADGNVVEYRWSEGEWKRIGHKTEGILIMEIVDGKKGHLCPECREFTPWPAYVFAHWHIAIVYECERCGHRVTLRAGELVEKSKKEVDGE